MADINSDDFRQLLDQIRSQSTLLEGIFKNTGGKGPSSNPDLTAANRGMRELGVNLRQANDGAKAANKETTLAARSLKAMQKGAKEVGGVLSDLARNSSQVSTDLTALNPAVRAVATGASAAATAIGSAAESVGAAASAFPHIFARAGGLIVSGIGTIVKTMGAEMAQQAGNAVTWYIAQLQEMTGHYQALSQSGGLAADGLTGMAQKANKMMTSMAALSQLSAKFGGDLAMVYGTVERGLSEVAKASEAMGDQRQKFLEMGISVEEQNESIAAYAKVHMWNARRERMSYTELSKAAQNYIRETDAISKILGVSRRELQDKQAAQHAKVRWGAVLESMAPEMANMLKNFMIVMEQQAGGPVIAAGLQEIFSGVVSENAAKIMPLGGAEALQVAAGIKAGQIPMLEGLEQLRQIIAQSGAAIKLTEQESLIGGLTQLDDVMVEFRTLAKAINQPGATLPELIAAAGKAQDVNDKSTANLAASSIAMGKTAQELNQMFIDTLPKATDVIKVASETMQKAVTDFRGVIDDVLKHFGKSSATPPPAPAEAPLSRMISGPQGNKSLNERIAGIESAGPNPYNRLVGGGPQSYANLTDMSIAEVTRFQGGMEARGHASTAVGKYQFLKGTLIKSAMEAGVSLNEKFTPENQEKIQAAFANANAATLRGAGINPTDAAIYLAHNLGAAGAKRFLKGSHGDLVSSVMSEKAMRNNPSLYMKNGEPITVGEAKARIAAKMGSGFKTGGISSGPNAGYMQLLHGTEAVVPLPDGNSIPISVAGPASTGMGSFGLPRVEIAASSAPINVQIPEIREMNTRMTEQMTAMQMQLGKLSEMIDIMRRGVQVNEKILQATRN